MISQTGTDPLTESDVNRVLITLKHSFTKQGMRQAFKKHFGRWIRLIGVLIWILPLTGFSQSISDTIRSQAQKIATALSQADYDTVALFTHKRIVDAFGGKDALITTTKHTISEMRSRGIVIDSTAIGTPGEPVKIGAWLVVTVPQRLFIKVPDGKLTADAYLIGISEDAGKKWTFIDNSIGDSRFAQLFPELAGKISLPAPKKPVFEKNGIVQGGVTNNKQPGQVGTNSTSSATSFGRQQK